MTPQNQDHCSRGTSIGTKSSLMTSKRARQPVNGGRDKESTTEEQNDDAAACDDDSLSVVGNYTLEKRETSVSSTMSTTSSDTTFSTYTSTPPLLAALAVPLRGRRRRLAIVFDLDGTLIMETDNGESLCDGQSASFIRPGAIEFLNWCKERGHHLGVWTAAHHSWGHYVTWKLCRQVCQYKSKRIGPAKQLKTRGASEESNKDGEKPCDDHDCQGSSCRYTFDFVWSGTDKLRQRKRIPHTVHGEHMHEGCRWCGAYRHSCDRCQCHELKSMGGAGLYGCPCRYTKDLSKLWRNKNAETANFDDKTNTIIVENTPQQCIRNYGNAVYVPTYSGDEEDEDTAGDGDEIGSLGDFAVFEQMKRLIEALEVSHDVRHVSKCNHARSYDEKGRLIPHACFQQSWLTQDYTGASGRTIPESSKSSSHGSDLACLPVGESDGSVVTSSTGMP